MHLTTVAKVRARLSLPDNDDEKLTDAITSAILAGDPAFSVRLRTKFEENSYVDKFNINSLSATASNGFVRLRTTAGFLQDDSLVVAYGDSLADAVSGGMLVPSTDYLADLEKGWVLIPESYIGKYAVLSYDAGFASVESVPDWLQEAATCHAITMMSIHQMDDKKPELVTALKTLQEQITHILDGHLRTNVTALNPLR